MLQDRDTYTFENQCVYINVLILQLTMVEESSVVNFVSPLIIIYILLILHLLVTHTLHNGSKYDTLWQKTLGIQFLNIIWDKKIWDQNVIQKISQGCTRRPLHQSGIRRPHHIVSYRFSIHYVTMWCRWQIHSHLHRPSVTFPWHIFRNFNYIVF